MNKTKLLFIAILTLTSLALSSPGVVSAQDAQTNIQNENAYYRDLAQKNKQAVVAIRVEIDPTKVRKTEEQNNAPSKRFMPRVMLPIYKETILYEEFGVIQAFSTGTGFIITQDGEVLTNYHVIDAYKEIYVTLANGSAYKADVMGFDEPADIALLKIKTEKPNFPFLTLGDSDTIMEPDPIIIIGNPFGLKLTVSVGTISGLNRAVYVHPQPLIQVQSSINPGNSDRKSVV